MGAEYDRSVRRWTRERWLFVLDLAICLALFAAFTPVTMQPDEPDGAGAGTSWDTVLLPAVLVPILLRRRWPLGAAAAFTAGCVVSGIPTFDQFRLGAAIPAGLLIAYSLGAREPRGRALAGLTLILAGMLVIGLTDVAQKVSGGVASLIAFSFPWCVGVWAGGRIVASRSRMAAELADRTRRLERQREQTAQLAVELERTQLALELDTAAGAGIRAVVELADRAERALASDSDAVRDGFARIERTAREALNEMRGLLGVLRSDERATRSPRPTLAQLDSLLAEARAGGRAVDLQVDGERRPLPGATELAAYRVIQHALVAVRGADQEPATVALRYLRTALELEVSGCPAEGVGAEAAVAAARERVTTSGGRFRADDPGPARRTLWAQLPIAVADV